MHSNSHALESDHGTRTFELRERHVGTSLLPKHSPKPKVISSNNLVFGSEDAMPSICTMLATSVPCNRAKSESHSM